MTLRDILPGRAILALIIGSGTGAFAAWAGLPLPWMLGPMIGSTIAAMLHAPVVAPAALRPVVIPIIGVMLGSSITVEVLAAVPGWALTVVMLVPFLIIAAGAAYVIYRWLGGFDHTTAYYAAMPGGLAEMLVMGTAAGGDERHIALAHATRILVVILAVSLFYGLVVGVTTNGGGTWTALDALTLRDWLILGLAAAIGAPLGTWIGLPAGQVFGPMILSGAAHVAGLVTVAPPTVVIIVAQVVIGTTIGCRFIGARGRDILRDMLLGTFASVAMILVAVGFAWLVARLTDTDLTQTFLAFSPGGLTEMSLLALAMHQDVAYVAVIHVIRIVMVIAGAAAMFRLFTPRRH